MHKSNCSGCGNIGYATTQTPIPQFRPQNMPYARAGNSDISDKLQFSRNISESRNESLGQFNMTDSTDYALNVGGASMQANYFNPESEMISSSRTMGVDTYTVANPVVSTANLSYAGGAGGSSGGG